MRAGYVNGGGRRARVRSVLEIGCPSSHTLSRIEAITAGPIMLSVYPPFPRPRFGGNREKAEIVIFNVR
jgi:hypothetical protein